MAIRFLKLFPSLFNEFKSEEHIFPPGASLNQIKTLEDNLGNSLPNDFRNFLLLTNGAQLFNKTIRFFPVSKFIDKNKMIKGNWFNSNHIFFA